MPISRYSFKFRNYLVENEKLYFIMIILHIIIASCRFYRELSTVCQFISAID